MQAAIKAGASSTALPELRQDLQLLAEVRDRHGSRNWRLYDPLLHRFHALSYKHLAMLQVWQGADGADTIVARVWQQHSEPVSAEEVADFASFLVLQGLAFPLDPNAWRQRLERVQKERRRLLSRLLHNYLFLRIPIADPQRFLASTKAFVRPLGSRAFAILTLALAALALLLVLREWDQFRACVSQLASPAGAFAILLAIPFVKLLHELGHGYVAVHYGCRVNAMGVAFILGAPLFYVDVTDSWRLKSRNARLAIDSAGIAVDLTIAVLATLAWVILPDGVPRFIAFGLATVGWTASLAINLNPFMKFDGYYLLSDVLELPNLQTRALALARWQLHELLFRLRLPPPEDLGQRLRRCLVLYGAAIMVYRIVLFTGIALAVYAFFFKLLGLVLFAVEIAYFILMPIWREIRDWYSMRLPILRSPRTWITAACIAGLLALAIIPWSTAITVPAMLEPNGFARVHASRPARFDAVHIAVGRHLAAGDALARLSSPSLDQELAVTDLRAAVIDLRLARLSSDPGDRELAIVLQAERQSVARKRAGLARQLEELDVVAPRAGSVVALADHAAPGRWVTPAEALVVVHGTDGMRILGLTAASDVGRIRAGMTATFVPNNILLPALPATVTEVATSNVAVVTQVELAESHGGPVPTRLAAKGGAVPLDSQYQVHARPSGSQSGYPPTQPQMGVLLVKGDARSLLARLWRRAVMVLIRESGF